MGNCTDGHGGNVALTMALHSRVLAVAVVAGVSGRRALPETIRPSVCVFHARVVTCVAPSRKVCTAPHIQWEESLKSHLAERRGRRH